MTVQSGERRVESGENRITERLLPLLSVLLFVGFFAIYASMAAPELDWGDAGESQLAIWTAGLSHPTGYPLFLMLGWLWAHILTFVGISPTRAVTLFSVTNGALAVAFLLPATQALLRRANATRFVLPLSVGVAIAFGFSTTFWSQALLAEVYTFHILLLILFLWGLWSSDNSKRLPWLALLYGIFLSHHRTAILWLPALLLWLWREARWIFRPTTFLQFAGLVALPQLAYLYIAVRGPITSYLHQALSPTQTLNLYDGSFRAFTDHILGTVFAADLGLQQSLSDRLFRVLGLLLANVTGMALALSLTLISRIPHFSHTTRSDLVLLLAGGAATLSFGLFYAIADVEVMFIPTWLTLYLLMALAIAMFWKFQPHVGWLVTIITVVILIAEPLNMQTFPDTRADHTAPRELVTTLFNAAPPENAILVTNDRNEMVPIWYTQFAEGQRQDVLGLFPLVTPAPEHTHVTTLVEWALQFNRPVYLTKPMPGLALRFDMEPATPPLVHVTGLAPVPSTPPEQSDITAGLTVTGWEPPTNIEAGKPVTISVGLLPATIQPNLSFSLQVFGEAETPITQTDVAPDVFYPPPQWELQQPIRQRFTLTLPETLPAGPLQWRLSTYIFNPDNTFTTVGQQIILGTTTR